MKRWTCVRTISLLGLFACAALAQTPAPSQPAQEAAAAPAAPQSILGPVDLSGIVDVYYDLNLNHPASGDNQLRNFDIQANQFSLNMAKVTLSHDPDPFGFRVDFGFGRAFETIHSAEAAPGIFRNIEQAYVSVKPARAKGLEVDFGEFVTAAGAEVIETKDNWNYSRSLLFAWAIPYYHFGLRATMPLGKHFTAGLHLVNGWNNIEDNNLGKTAGLTGALAVGKVTWTQTYYVGPEKTGTNQGLRHLYDTTLLVNATKTASFYINYDYGVDKKIGGGESRWTGIAGAARFQVTPLFALAPRLEWFNDADGFSTGTAQKVKEFTFTGEFKLREGVLSRLEYRRDWSNVPFFDRGAGPGVYKNQNTLLAGLVAYFGPKK
ncbi:MAG: porin [Bryobacteraceae bacterium]|jgi:hypothetical protein